jgi:hypothetical protein
MASFETNHRTLYERIGEDTGIEECVRRNTWFYQPYRRERETVFLKGALKHSKSEADLVHQYDVRLNDLYYRRNHLIAWWIFSNRVKCRDVIAFVAEKDKNGS